MTTATLCQHVETAPGVWVCPTCKHKAHTSHAPARECGPAKPRQASAAAPQRVPEQPLAVCAHRGLALHKRECKPCQAHGLKEVQIWSCEIHTECTDFNTSIQPRVKACATCQDYQALTQISLPTPAVVSRKPTPLPAAISDTRNLIYHVYPLAKSEAWRWNIAQLCQRIGLFNGVRAVGIALDSKTAGIEDVQAEFARHGAKITHWIIRDNDPELYEGSTYHGLLSTLPRDDSTTFFGHAKGVTHDARPDLQLWPDLMYEISLDDPAAVRSALEQFPVAGPFKRHGEFKFPDNHQWHFSGSFFWFRNQDTFSRFGWSRLQPSRFSIESWPANIYTAGEAASLFGVDLPNLYWPGALEKTKQQWEAFKRANRQAKQLPSL